MWAKITWLMVLGLTACSSITAHATIQSSIGAETTGDVVKSVNQMKIERKLTIPESKPDFFQIPLGTEIVSEEPVANLIPQLDRNRDDIHRVDPSFDPDFFPDEHPGTCQGEKPEYCNSTMPECLCWYSLSK